MRRLGFPWTTPHVPAGVERDPPPCHSGPDYDTAWARCLPARYARFLAVEGPVSLVVRLLCSPTTAGLDRLDGLGAPAIFAANHHSHLDTPLVLSSVPGRWRHRMVVAAAADHFFANRWSSAASALAIGAIPIERFRVGRRSAERAADLIDEGWSLLIFPEGGRSPDGWGQGHRGGAAYLALRCGAPVVPVHIEGTGRIFAKGDRRPRPGTTQVTFGRPIGPGPGESARRLAARIEAAVAALADEVATDWWSARRRAAAGTSPSLTGPEATSWRRAWALGDRRAPSRGARPSRRPSWPAL